MDQYEMMDQEIRSKQRRLDEARETYQRSCKVLERKYDESRSKQNQLHQILEKSHSLFKHLLDEEEGDKTELTYQLIRLHLITVSSSIWLIEIASVS